MVPSERMVNVLILLLVGVLACSATPIVEFRGSAGFIPGAWDDSSDEAIQDQRRGQQVNMDEGGASCLVGVSVKQEHYEQTFMVPSDWVTSTDIHFKAYIRPITGYNAPSLIAGTTCTGYLNTGMLDGWYPEGSTVFCRKPKDKASLLGIRDIG